jgi:hypothetical protein
MWTTLFLLGGLTVPAAPSGPAAETPPDPLLYALEGGAAWLTRHQAESGSIGSAAASGGSVTCDCLHGGFDLGRPDHDVGRTALALVALMQSEDPGRFGATIRGGVRYLLGRQAAKDGLIGDRVGKAFLYDHCIATWALARGLQLVPGELEDLAVGAGLERAVALVLAARNPAGGWRYDLPPIGDNDTSVTTWAVLALAEAREVGVQVPEEAWQGAHRFLLHVTDPITGRIGYSAPGEPSARETLINDHHPREAYETMTASGLRALGALGRVDESAWATSLELLVRGFPAPLEETDAVPDLYGLHHAAWVLARMRGKQARAHLLEIGELGPARQEAHGCRVGSWGADTVWGHAGGRVYTTALWVLTLQEVRAAQQGRTPTSFDQEALAALALEQEARRRRPFPRPEERLGLPGWRTTSSTASRAGVDWLVRHQTPTGEWSDGSFPRRCRPGRDRDICSSPGSGYGSGENAVGLTSLCVLALLGAGADPTKTSDLDAAAAAGLRFLLEVEPGPRSAPPTKYMGRDWLRDRGLPALALTEGYLCCGSPELAEQARWSLEGILLDRSGYGWGGGLPALPGAAALPHLGLRKEDMEPNIVSTALAARVLALGDALGLVTFEPALREDLARWADSLIYADGFQVSYSLREPQLPLSGNPLGDVRAGSLGWIALATGRLETDRVQPVLERAMEFDPGELEESAWRNDLEGLGSLAGSIPLVRNSTRWSKELEKYLQEHQESDRKECCRGSWSFGSMSSSSRGGRCYETARCVLILQARERFRSYEKALDH